MESRQSWPWKISIREKKVALNLNRPPAREDAMKKKRTLPKNFQEMLRKLKQLDDELGISLKAYDTPREVRERNKRKERETLLNQIWQNWPRRMVCDKNVLQMRGNASRNSEVKAVLKKTDSRIEDCALIGFWNEEHMGKRWDCSVYCSPEDIKSGLIEGRFGFKNLWESRNRYEWGGPNDLVKILFRRSGNSRYKVIGIIQMFHDQKAAA
jgi:hypothetical protein